MTGAEEFGQIDLAAHDAIAADLDGNGVRVKSALDAYGDLQRELLPDALREVARWIRQNARTVALAHPVQVRRRMQMHRLGFAWLDRVRERRSDQTSPGNTDRRRAREEQSRGAKLTRELRE